MIVLKNINKSYGNGSNRSEVLKNINIEIESGKFVMIIGQSGSGKSTLLNILGCLDTPDSGEYLLENVPINKLTLKQRTKVRGTKMGFIFQAFNLIPELTVFENIALPLIYRGMKKNERDKKVIEVIDLVGLNGKAKRFMHQLSGGEQQRVAIARALGGDPVVLFADEPTGNLDTKTAADIIDLLQELNKVRRTTIIMVTHNPAHTEYCNQLIKIEDGEVVNKEM